MTDEAYSNLIKEIKEVRDALASASRVCSEDKKESYNKAVDALNVAINQLQNTNTNVVAPGFGMGSSSSSDDSEEE